jgi:hypothetical protein
MRVGTHDSPHYAALSALQQGGATRGALTLTFDYDQDEPEDDLDDDEDWHSDGSLAANFGPMPPEAGHDSDDDSDAGV